MSVACHRVFAECRQRLNLSLSERNCRFDSCQIGNMACSSLEHAADECKKVDVCVDWRSLTNGTCSEKTSKHFTLTLSIINVVDMIVDDHNIIVDYLS